VTGRETCGVWGAVPPGEHCDATGGQTMRLNIAELWAGSEPRAWDAGPVSPAPGILSATPQGADDAAERLLFEVRSFRRSSRSSARDLNALIRICLHAQIEVAW
jgi:hypothetical protein